VAYGAPPLSEIGELGPGRLLVYGELLEPSDPLLSSGLARTCPFSLIHLPRINPPALPKRTPGPIPDNKAHAVRRGL